MMLSKDTITRLITVLDLLEEGVQSGQRLLDLESEPTWRERLAGAVLGDGASDNADDAATMLHCATKARKALLAVLAESGVIPFDGIGVPINDERHEVVGYRDDDSSRDRVVEVHKVGYANGECIIRKATVTAGR